MRDFPFDETEGDVGEVRETPFGVAVDLDHVHSGLQFGLELDAECEQPFPLGLHLLAADRASGAETDDAGNVEGS
jgi:hypothetical protein